MSETTTTSLKTYADFQKYNFFRRPEWRFERVLALVDRNDATPGRCTKRDDPIVRAARSFVLTWRNGDDEKREKLLWENPGLYYAYDFYKKTGEDADASMYIQARLLARQTPEEIGDIMGVMPEAVRWYADLFFDVIPHLDRRDWITKHVLVPAVMRSGVKQAVSGDMTAPLAKDSTVAVPFMDGTVKMFAYFGGKFLVDAMLGGMQAGQPLTRPDDLGNWLDKTISNTVRRRAMQASVTFEINKYNVLELMAVHTRIMEIEKSDESQEQTRSTQERHIKALMDEIPWVAGADGEKVYQEDMGVVGRLDNMAGELRDDELLLLASGRVVPALQDKFPAQLPPPRREKKSVLGAQDVELP